MQVVTVFKRGGLDGACAVTSLHTTAYACAPFSVSFTYTYLVNGACSPRSLTELTSYYRSTANKGALALLGGATTLVFTNRMIPLQAKWLLLAGLQAYHPQQAMASHRQRGG